MHQLLHFAEHWSESCVTSLTPVYRRAGILPKDLKRRIYRTGVGAQGLVDLWIKPTVPYYKG